MAEQFAAKPFDYIVIGGGTAGLVVASRLSERSDLHVGVLEAGYEIPENTPAVSVPGRFGDGIGTEYDWKFETTPQCQLDGRKLAWPRGKALGGSSALNFMTWNRPNRGDLDAWEKLGCKGWGWDDMIPFYKKSETFIKPDSQSAKQHKLHFDANTHGTDGPVTISFNKEYSETHQHWHETLENLNVATNTAHMSGSNVGAWTSMVAVNPGTATREYSASAYYNAFKERSNLSVLTGATVRKIVLEETTQQQWIATGIQFEHKGSLHTVHASKEIILSAGSVQSPQILELSGIGNPEILASAGIETKVANRNVGENLQDHILTATIYDVNPAIATPDDLRGDPHLAAAADEQYKTHRTGPRTLLACSFAYLAAPTFIPTPTLSSLASRLSKSSKSAGADILAAHLDASSTGGHMEYIFDVGNWNPIMPTAPGKKYATLLQILQYPYSRGSVHIDSSAPQGPPVINPQYYEGDGEIDLEIQLHAAKFGEKILETEPMRSFIGERVWPPKNIGGEDWRKWIVDNTATDWHPIGTCSMGSKEEGVVDEHLKVHGVTGLRVVDASIMPLQISAHLQATVYAIGEKGASLILDGLAI